MIDDVCGKVPVAVTPASCRRWCCAADRGLRQWVHDGTHLVDHIDTSSGADGDSTGGARGFGGLGRRGVAA